MSIQPISGVDAFTAVPAGVTASQIDQANAADDLLRAAAATQAQQTAQVQAVTRAGQAADVRAAAQVQAAQNAQDLNGVQFLTAGDRDFLEYLYGPQAVQNVAAPDQTQTQTPQFVQDLIDARRTGELPAGTELTSSFVQGRFDAYVAATGTLQVANPLTTQQLSDAQDYFNRRVAGAAVDLQV